MDEAQADPAIRFIVTFGHRPAFSSGHHPGDSGLQSIMAALGDAHSKYVLNLNGHSHDYERSRPQHGVTHITCGHGRLEPRGGRHLPVAHVRAAGVVGVPRHAPRGHGAAVHGHGDPGASSCAAPRARARWT
jgi:hypothetical protein